MFETDQRLSVESLAQEIRRVDGSHSLGAAALAEALVPFLSAASGKAVAELQGLRYVRDYIANSGQDYGIGSYRPNGPGFERNFSNREDLLCCVDGQIEKLSAIPATVTDKDVERACRAHYGLRWEYMGCKEPPRNWMRAALESFANKERE